MRQVRRRTRELADLLDQRYRLDTQARSLAAARSHWASRVLSTLCWASSCLCSPSFILGRLSTTPPSHTEWVSCNEASWFSHAAWMLFGVIALLGVAGIVLAGGSQIFSLVCSTWPIAQRQFIGGVKSHADLITNCAACHTAPWSSQDMADGCLTCHQDVLAQLADPAEAAWYVAGE